MTKLLTKRIKTSSGEKLCLLISGSILISLIVLVALNLHKTNETKVKQELYKKGISYTDARIYCKYYKIEMEDFVQSPTLQSIYKRAGKPVIVVHKYVEPARYR